MFFNHPAHNWNPVRAASSIVAFLFLFAVAVLLTPSSYASWTGFTSISTSTGTSNPSCAEVSTEHVVCAVLSEKAEMMVNEYSTTKWGSWSSLAGTIVSAPTCTSDGTGKAFCAATAATGDLEVSIFSGSSWGTPTQVTAALYSAPSCAKYVEGEVLCMARSANGQLSWSLYSDGKWKIFSTLSYTSLYAPSCTSDGDNGVICSFVTNGGATAVDRYVAGSWKGAINIGGLTGRPTSCNYWKTTGEVACFLIGTDSQPYVSTFNGGTWSATNWTGYGGLGGQSNDVPSCTTQATGDMVCGLMGIQDNEFFSNVYTASSSSWSGWNLVGGKGIGSPSCVPFETGKAMCVVKGLNNAFTSTVGP